MIFPTRAPSLFPGLSLRMPRVPVTIQTRFFFDGAEVKNALSNLEYEGAWRSSILVRRTAQKSIQKVGAARPRLKVMRDNPNVPMKLLLKQPGLRQSTRDGLKLRIMEIQFPPSSPPGTPPYTHVPHSHMLGFRRNLYNAMDPSFTSAVVGPSAKGRDPKLPHLHEYGGTRRLVEHAFLITPQQQRQWSGGKLRFMRALTKWTSPNEPPGGGFLPTGNTRSVTYPKRPFMRPALQACLPQIVRLYAGKFNAKRQTFTPSS